MNDLSNSQPFIPNLNTGYENSDLTIDGESAEDIAGVVKTNIPKFMDNFKSGKKFSWNWAGLYSVPIIFSLEKCIKRVQYSLLFSLQ